MQCPARHWFTTSIADRESQDCCDDPFHCSRLFPMGMDDFPQYCQHLDKEIHNKFIEYTKYTTQRTIHFLPRYLRCMRCASNQSTVHREKRKLSQKLWLTFWGYATTKKSPNNNGVIQRKKKLMSTPRRGKKIFGTLADQHMYNLVPSVFSLVSRPLKNRQSEWVCVIFLFTPLRGTLFSVLFVWNVVQSSGRCWSQSDTDVWVVNCSSAFHVRVPFESNLKVSQRKKLIARRDFGINLIAALRIAMFCAARRFGRSNQPFRKLSTEYRM